MAKDSVEKTSSEPAVDFPKCCLCRQPVEKDGSCYACQRWPINVTPRRTCPDCHGLVDTAGFCRRCLAFTRTEMEPGKGEWVDTGRIPVLLSREENQRRMRELVAMMAEKMVQHQPKVRDLAAEKAQILAMQREPAGVPC